MPLITDGGAQVLYHRNAGFTIKTVVYLPKDFTIIKHSITRGLPKGIPLRRKHPRSDYRYRKVVGANGSIRLIWVYHWAIQGESPSLRLVLRAPADLTSFCIRAVARPVGVKHAPIQRASKCYTQ